MESPTIACSDTEKEHNYSDQGFPRMRRPRPRIVISSTADLNRYRNSQLCEDIRRFSVSDPLELLRFLSFTQRPNHVGNLSKATDDLSKNDSSCTRNQHSVRRDAVCLSTKLVLTSNRHLASGLDRKLYASLSCSTGRRHSSMMRKSTLLKVKKTRQLKSRSLSFDKGVLETSKDLVELSQRQEDTSLVISNIHTASVSRNSSMIKKDSETEKQTTSPKTRRTGLSNQQEDLEIGQKAETMAINVIDKQYSEQDIVEDKINVKRVEEREETLLEAISKTESFKKLSCPIEIDRDSGHVSDEVATMSSQGGHQKSCRTLSLCSDITSSPIEEIASACKKSNSQTTPGNSKVSPFSHGVSARLSHNSEQNQESGPPVVEKFGTKRHSSDPVGSSNALNHVTSRIGSILESTAKEQRPSSFHAYDNSMNTPTSASKMDKLEPLPDSTKQGEEDNVTHSPSTPHTTKSPPAAPMSVEDLDIGDLESDWVRAENYIFHVVNLA